MPKPVRKMKGKSPQPASKRLPLREVANLLQTIYSSLHDNMAALDGLYQALYARGLDSRGPITETEDDIPF